MKRTRFSAALLAILMVLSMMTTLALAASPSQNQVYNSMIALKSDYPEGMHWTNENSYEWRGGIFSYGLGCAGFAFILSDAAFGYAPARMVFDFTYDDVRVGDILRVNNDSHSVVVMEKYSDHVVLAEGNYNSSIHWGRTMSRDEVMRSDYIMTRYEEPAGDEPVESVEPFTDVPVMAFYADAVQWAVEEDITKGTSATAFSPDAGCTRGQVVTFLWRAMGSPEVSSKKNPFTDVKPGSYYYKAVLWAVENNITAGTTATTFSPNDTCTRAQIVTFLWRAGGSEEWFFTSDFFRDVQKNTYYYSAVAWALANDITTGTTASTFSPDNTCTRGQVVTFLFRFLGNRGGMTDPNAGTISLLDSSY